MHHVSELMIDTVFTLQPSDTLNDARTLMKLAKIRNTPVTDDEGNFVGLITNRDLLACTISRLADIDEKVQEEIDTAIRVSDVMQCDVDCVTPGYPAARSRQTAVRAQVRLPPSPGRTQAGRDSDRGGLSASCHDPAGQKYLTPAEATLKHSRRTIFRLFRHEKKIDPSFFTHFSAVLPRPCGGGGLHAPA